MTVDVGSQTVVSAIVGAALSTALASLSFEHIEAPSADGQSVLERVDVGWAFVLEHEHEAHATRGARVALLAVDCVLLVDCALHCVV